MPDIASISRQSSMADSNYNGDDASSPVGSPQAKDFPLMQGTKKEEEKQNRSLSLFLKKKTCRHKGLNMVVCKEEYR